MVLISGFTAITRMKRGSLRVAVMYGRVMLETVPQVRHKAGEKIAHIIFIHISFKIYVSLKCVTIGSITIPIYHSRACKTDDTAEWRPLDVFPSEEDL